MIDNYLKLIHEYGCLSIGWRLIYRLILNMQNLSAKSFFLLALSFFSFYPSHPSRFLFLNFNCLIMKCLSLLYGVMDSRNVYQIHHAIQHLLTLSITSFRLSSCWKCFLCTWFGTKMKVFGTKLASGFKILYLCGVLTTQIPQWQ